MNIYNSCHSESFPIALKGRHKMNKAMSNQITIYERDLSGFSIHPYKSEEKKKIIAYMKSFEPNSVAGLIEDCITGERQSEENLGFTDGHFSWSSQDIYHIEKYNAAVSDDFIIRVIKANER